MAGSSNRNCRTVSGTVQVRNSTYDNTGAPVVDAPVIASSPDDDIDSSDSSNWGQTARFAGGRGIVYERELGNGKKMITFVTWAQ